MKLSDDDLRALLIQSGKVTDAQLQSTAEFAAKSEIPFQQALIEQEVITDEDLGPIIAQYYQAPYISLSSLEIPDEVLRIIPVEVAKKQGAVIFFRDATTIKLALSDPTNVEIQQMIAKKTGTTILPHFATDKDIENTLLAYTQDLQKTFEKLLKEGIGTASEVEENDDPPIEKIVDLLILSAYQEKTSDIHIEPQDKNSLIRFRIDGILHDVLSIPKVLHDRVVTRIKILSNLRTDEHLSSQDGKIRTRVSDSFLDLRVSILPISNGEKVVMRLLTANSRTYTLTDLGMSPTDLAKITRAFSKSFGMILSTGPTGAGKTTSIYAIISILNTREKNITTIEDPVEYRIKGANQVQVNTKTNLTFANGLRSILRQDPNYIFVGEIRDSETASIAVNAALTGHLVLSTLHTNDAASAAPRLIDMKVEPFLVASTLNVIIAQRLVRKICDHCRISYTMPVEELKKNLSLESINKHYIPQGKTQEVRLYKGQGCKTCHFTGYQGRLGLFEVLEMTKELRQLVSEKKDADVINRAAVEGGMTTMLDDGLEKVTKGMTTIEEVLRVTKVETQ